MTLHAAVLLGGLTMLRVVAFSLTAPVVDNRNLPVLWRLLVSALVTVTILPFMKPGHLPGNLVSLVADGVWELGVGLALGMVLNLTVGAAITAGNVADYQVSFANAGLLNPAGGAPQPILGNFYQMVVLLTALGLNLHVSLLRLLVESFRWLPCGLPGTHAQGLATLVWQASGDFFMATLWLAMPVMVVMLGLEAVVGLLSRLLPQMNMLVAAAPVRVLVGLCAVSLALPTTINVMAHILQTRLDQVGALFV